MVGRDDNEVLNLYRGECKFSALHMSAFGTKGVSLRRIKFGRYWSIADIPQASRAHRVTRLTPS
jgi:hypothetical protein